MEATIDTRTSRPGGWLREPLLHFLLIGAALFMLFRVLNGGDTGAPRDIVISEARVEALTRIASSRYAGTPSGRALRDVVGTVPTLVIWGGADAIIPPPAPGELTREGTTLHVLPGRGHMVQSEAADEVNRLIDDFLFR
jgi:pimeloyl-ACP methyl ester carboxylesterase